MNWTVQFEVKYKFLLSNYAFVQLLHHPELDGWKYLIFDGQKIVWFKIYSRQQWVSPVSKIQQSLTYLARTVASRG